jgi:antitoxin (DNA-binding transcriptional repressor) of toxin-antitoxin stability system
MKQTKAQIGEVTPKLIQVAIKKGERLVVFDGGEPIALITGATAELGRHRDFFVHYPHDPSECFNTCWRHNGAAESEGAAPSAEAAPVAEPVGASS